MQVLIRSSGTHYKQHRPKIYVPIPTFWVLAGTFIKVGFLGKQFLTRYWGLIFVVVFVHFRQHSSYIQADALVIPHLGDDFK